MFVPLGREAAYFSYARHPLLSPQAHSAASYFALCFDTPWRVDGVQRDSCYLLSLCVWPMWSHGWNTGRQPLALPMASCVFDPSRDMYGHLFPGLWHHPPVVVAAQLTINPWLLLCVYLIYSFVINTTNYNSPQLISCATCPLLGPDYFLMCKDHVQNMEDLMMILDISKVERSENGGWRTSLWAHYVSVLDP